MTAQYTVYKISITGNKDELIALLLDSEIGGLEETDDGLQVYTETGEQAAMVEALLYSRKLDFSVETIPNQNWNKLWESNFEPVTVSGHDGNPLVHVRASFHPSFAGEAYEIVITPKMSFGTGHHETTCQVIQLMELIDFRQKSVIDFGTGTGILAILAEKMGASKIIGIDYDEWCMVNARENGEINGSVRCQWIFGDHIREDETADIILANINLNIILSNLEGIKAALEKGGDLILSGLLASDEHTIRPALEVYGLEIVRLSQRNNWIAIHCKN